jgi:hypothetical protein
MLRFTSFKFVPSETRGVLRDRFDRKLRTAVRMRNPPPVTAVPDSAMLRLLQSVAISRVSDLPHAEAMYAGAGPSKEEPQSIEALRDQGWLEVVWGRVFCEFGARQTAAKAERPLLALEALYARIYEVTYRWDEAARADAELGPLVNSIFEDDARLDHVSCRDPAWVAGRLWEKRNLTADATDQLRHWVDRWRLLRHPSLTPDAAWSEEDAEAFRSTALRVIESEPGLRNWQEARGTYVRRLTLRFQGNEAEVEARLPQIPVTLVDRAVWIRRSPIQRLHFDSFHFYDDLLGLARLLSADIIEAHNARAPHPLAERLISLAIERFELFAWLLQQVRSHPVLLAELVIHPPTAALACFLIASWEFPGGAWDRAIVDADDRIGQADAFADAADILGEHLRERRAPPEEAAALLKWLHQSAGPEFADESTDHHRIVEILKRELSGSSSDLLLAMAISLKGPEFDKGIGSAEFSAFLDLVDLGGLFTEIDASAVIEAYASSIERSDYGLTAHRVGVKAATALAELSLQSPELRQAFLYPVNAGERLHAASADANPFSLADSIGRSIRAHIRILCRALIGMDEAPAADLIGALVACVRAGALSHKERARVEAFAPRFERDVVGARSDRPLAFDLGAAISSISTPAQITLLDALLETDEPTILAQVIPLVPPPLRGKIQDRIMKLAPEDAGAIHSLVEMEARIDELLDIGAADAAARYMEAEEKLLTLGQVPGRKLTRFRNRLRLLYLRGDWKGIRDTERPTFSGQLEQAAADELLELHRGLLALKGPIPDPTYAKDTFLRLFYEAPFGDVCHQLVRGGGRLPIRE